MWRGLGVDYFSCGDDISFLHQGRKRRSKRFKKDNAVNEEGSVLDIEHITLSRTNLSMQIADHLEEVILTSPSKVSDKLPSEMNLAKQYNVSRPVVREAIKLLQERGLVTLKTGSGAYITRPETSTVMNAINRIMQVDQISSEELTEVRAILELSGIELAVGKITDEELEEIDSILTQFENKTLPFKIRVSLDEAFHLALAKATGNNLLALFIGTLTSLLRDYMGKGILIEGGIEDAIARHRQIYHALRARYKEAAIQAMREHLKVSSYNVRVFDEQLHKKKNDRKTQTLLPASAH